MCYMCLRYQNWSGSVVYLLSISRWYLKHWVLNSAPGVDLACLFSFFFLQFSSPLGNLLMRVRQYYRTHWRTLGGGRNWHTMGKAAKVAFPSGSRHSSCQCQYGLESNASTVYKRVQTFNFPHQLVGQETPVYNAMELFLG